MCKNKAEFDKLVEKRRKLLATKKKAELELDKVNADMEEYLKAKGTPGEGSAIKVVFGTGYKASLIEVTRYDPDKDKLQLIFGDKYNSITKETTYSMIKVS